MNYIGCAKFIRYLSSIARQNFSKECEQAINQQIKMELQACHDYLAMAYQFDRDDNKLPGIYAFLLKSSHEEREHAEKLMKYMNKRGGTIKIIGLDPPKSVENLTAKGAMCEALDMELSVNKNLLAVHSIAQAANDANFCDFLEANYLQEQVDAIHQIAGYINQIERCEKEFGIYLFDINFK